MVGIADAEAIKEQERVLPQHQAAITLLLDLLGDPKIDAASWLDLACGQGQMLVAAEHGLQPPARAKVRYSGCDLDAEYAREAERTASRLGFASYAVKVGELVPLAAILGDARKFNLITVTNAVHEIPARQLGALLVDCVCRLADGGHLYVSDMETIAPFELGAVPYRHEEITAIASALFESLGAKGYVPQVSRWPYRTRSAWTIQVQRRHLGVPDEDLIRLRDIAVTKTDEAVVRVLQAKRSGARKTLESLTRYGASTADEEADKMRLLFDFWALDRSLESFQ